MLRIISTLKQNAAKALFCSAALLSSAASYGQTWSAVGDPNGISSGGASDISMVATGKAGMDTLYVAYKDASTTDGLMMQMYTTTGGWSTVSSASFATNVRSAQMLMAGTIPTVAFGWGAGAHSFKANVLQYNTTPPTSLGTPDFSAGGIHDVAFVYGGGLNFYVGYRDASLSEKACFKKYDGSSFVSYGVQGFSTGAANYMSAALYDANTPMCIYSDGGSTNLPTPMYYNGSAWAAIGSTISSSASAYTQIASNKSITYAVFSDFGNAKQAVAYSFTGAPSGGTSWANVGPLAGFTTDEADYISLALEGSGVSAKPAIAFSRMPGGKANVMHFDGTTWTAVGPVDFSAGAATNTILALNKGGDYFVAYADASKSGKLVVMKFNNPNAVPNVPTNTNKLDVYPNPSKGEFTVKGTAKGTYTVVNTVGQIVKTIELNASNNNSVTVTNLNSGTYFIKGTNGVNQKVVVTK